MKNAGTWLKSMMLSCWNHISLDLPIFQKERIENKEIGISRVYGEYLTYNDSNYYKGRKSSNISYR